MNDDPAKVILKICDTKLVLDVDTAMKVAKELCSQNLQRLEHTYRKDEVSGNYGYVDSIKKVKMEEVSVSFIPAVDYFRLCEEGDKSE